MHTLEDSDIILVKPMDYAAAYDLLHRKLGEMGRRDEVITELAASLHHMPLPEL